MLEDYEKDYYTGMDIKAVSEEITGTGMSVKTYAGIFVYLGIISNENVQHVYNRAQQGGFLP